MLRLQPEKDFLLMIVLAILLILLILFGINSPLRIVLGLAFIVICPGYALQAALFPAQKDLRGIERIALSFALSIVVVPLLILFLNYTPWGISLNPVLIILTFYLFLVSLFGIYRRSSLPEEQRFKLIRPDSTTFKKWFKKWFGVSLGFSLTAMGVIIFSLISFYFFAAAPRGNGFSEFYLMTPENRSENFSQIIKGKKEVEFIVGLVNYELEDSAYTIKVYVDNAIYAIIGPFNLKKGEKREETVRLSPDTDFTGNVKVECVLFKDYHIEPYRTVHLWIE